MAQGVWRGRSWTVPASFGLAAVGLCLACSGGGARSEGLAPPRGHEAGSHDDAGGPIATAGAAATAGGGSSDLLDGGAEGGASNAGSSGQPRGGQTSDDSGIPIAGATNAGAPDGGQLDGGTPDGGMRLDAGSDGHDADVSDASSGVDAGGVTTPDAGGGSDGGSALIDAPRNVIFLLADGYGAQQIEATRIYVNGNSAPLSFETLPHMAWVKTHNARNQTTDSAAAATALATGHKVDSSVVSVAVPGDGADLRTALELQKARGKRVGLVTTHTPITDASPAAFGSHAASRNNTAELAATYFDETRPNVLFGLTATGITEPVAQAAGYTVVTDAAELAALDLDSEAFVSGQFSEGTLPPLADLALAALEVVSQSSEGFFLFVEQEQTDSGGHANDLSTVISAGIEFNTMVEQVLSWAQGRDDTLIVVGADHETGGLTLNEPSPTQGVLPGHSYSTTGHSGVDVPFFATGVGAERITGTLDNTELFPLFAGYQAVHCVDNAACVAGARFDVLREATPDAATAGLILQADLDDAGFELQSLLAFGDLTGLLPVGCSFQAAHLVLPVSNASTNGVRLHRMLTSWDTTSTWNSFGGDGIQANGAEANAVADAQSSATSIGVLTFNVTSAVAAWLADPSSNQGWALLAQGTDGINLASPASSTPPELRLFCE